jgi:uncharacterized repeat protein (TIGR03803 family)
MKKIISFLMVIFFLGISLCRSQFSTLLSFDSNNGKSPTSNLTLSGNELYGITPFGGSNSLGCIFKINTDGSGYTKLHDFAMSDNCFGIYGSLVLSGDVLYGMSISGGANSKGCIFKINTDGNGLTPIFNFSGTADGASPMGSLTLSGDVLYGMTKLGGINNLGCIFVINTNGSGFNRLFSFSGTPDGSKPIGSLLLSGNALYGMTPSGGASDLGCIFTIHTDGSDYTNLFDFDGGDDGESPFGSLVLMGTTLFGMTYGGGGYGMGSLFSYEIDGAGYKTLIDFNLPRGYQPNGSLAIVGNSLFGLTSKGGYYDYGCIFQYDIDIEGFTIDWEFDSAMYGSYPQADLVYSGYALYGMTSFGGENNDGVIFNYVLSPDTQTSSIVIPFKGISIANITWTNGDGEKRVVFLKEGTGSITEPTNYISYNASNDWSSKGSQLGTSGYYCIYNGNESEISLINLSPGTTYTVEAFEYNGGTANAQYLPGEGLDNPITFQTESLTPIDFVSEIPVKIYSEGSAIYAVISNYRTNVRLAVYDISGTCIYGSGELKEGLNKIEMDCQPGIYIVKLQMDDKLSIKKINIYK